MIQRVLKVAANSAITLALACLTTATMLPQAAAAEKPAKLSKEERKDLERDRKYRDSIDRVIEKAQKDGKTILIVGTLGLKNKYPTDASLHDSLADQVTDTGTSAAIDLSMAVEWTHAEDPGLMVAVGQKLTSSAIGPFGFYYRFEGREADYLVYIVEPGTYFLRNIGYPKPRSTFNKGHGTVAGRGTASVGQLRQVATNILEAEQTMVFLNAASTTVAASEQCNWWYKGVCTQSVYTPEHTKQTRAAGLYPKTDYLPIPALDVSIKFEDDIASFEAGPGEVVLVDGIFAEPLDTQMAVSGCRNGESMQVCTLQSVDLTLAAASVDELRAYDFAAAHFPRLGKLVGSIQHRQLQINATSLGKVKFGERYRVSAR